MEEKDDETRISTKLIIPQITLKNSYPIDIAWVPNPNIAISLIESVEISFGNIHYEIIPNNLYYEDIYHKPITSLYLMKDNLPSEIIELVKVHMYNDINDPIQENKIKPHHIKETRKHGTSIIDKQYDDWLIILGAMIIPKTSYGYTRMIGQDEHDNICNLRSIKYKLPDDVIKMLINFFLVLPFRQQNIKRLIV